MLNLKSLSFIIFVTIVLVSCKEDSIQDSDAVENEYEGTSITQYTNSTEIFMEYPALVINEEAKFLIHLTDLKDFKAVTKGVLKIKFTNQAGNTLTFQEDKPARDGIYIPVVKFTNPGIYEMRMDLIGEQVSDVMAVQDVIVYANDNEIPLEEEEAAAHIGFLKEQQWKIDFANEPVVKRDMQESVIVTGEIREKPEFFSKVVSPISGITLSKNNESLKSIGSFVKKDETLLNISPPVNAGENIQKIKNDYLLSKAEYERVKELFDKNAVSQKRLSEAKFDFQSKQSSYSSLLDLIKITENGYSIVSPIDGYIENLNFNFGDQIKTGQELFTIINPNRLILKANVPSSKFESANSSQDASFKVEGSNQEYRVSLLKGRKLSVAASLNENNRTIPVYFEFNNPQNKIKVGMYAEVYVKVGDTKEYISIPESAIINEDGLQTAYVQIEGEAFEKRILKTGVIDNGYVQIIDGLNEGERVVTEGAYQVRLAALAPESAIGHGHVH